jgi:hypothetical protein
MLRPVTLQLISEILAYPLLENAGKPGADQFGRAINSWDEAIRGATNPKWERLCQTCSNRINQQCVAFGVPRERSWNAIVAEVNRTFAPAAEKIDRFFSAKNASWGLGGHVVFQLRSAIEEIEYSDIVVPFFFFPVLLPIYRSGFYPCGWTGEAVSRAALDGSLVCLPAGQVNVH